MKILLYGGTFDPPHWGHINNLRAAMQAVQPDRVIVMPAGIPPHKAASATPGELRLKMCECFLRLGSQVEVSDWEIAHGGKSYTVNTLRMLHESAPQAQLYLTVGSDMLASFCTWRKWQEILRLAVLVVESREADDAVQLAKAAEGLRQSGGRVVFAKAKPLPMSSSQIRQGSAGPEAVPPEVWQIMCSERLYQCKGEKKTMNYQQAEDMVRRTLSAKRFQHTVNVKDMAVRMAQHYGENADKAALAAILHDSAKEMPRAELLQIMQDNAIIAKGAQNRPEPVWHGVCAAILAKTRWGIQDEEILSAIACHTTGKENMSRLDKILFLADMTSAERDYPGVDELRRLEMQDLDKAMIRALTMTIDFVKQKNAAVDEESAKALAWLQAHSVEASE